MDSELGALLQKFFDDHLVKDVGGTDATRSSYRDAIKLYVRFLLKTTRKRSAELQLEHFTRQSVLAFLNHLEEERHNSRSTRNHRLAVLRALAEFIGIERPDLLYLTQPVARIPSKRTADPPVRYLEKAQVAGLLAAPSESSRLGSRDRALMAFLYNSGARAQESCDARVRDFDPARRQVRVTGKGGKARDVNLWKKTVDLMIAYLKERGSTADDSAPLFTSSRLDQPLSRAGLYKVVRKYALGFESHSKAFKQVHTTPHTFRHTMVTHALEDGVDPRTLQAMVGHAQLSTTLKYGATTVEAKRRALKLTEPNASLLGRSARPGFRKSKSLLDWLDGL